MKKTLLSVIACFGLALSMCAAVAADSFKPSGVELRTVSAQALPDNSGAPAAVAVAADAVPVNTQANAAIQVHRSLGERAAFVADVRPMAVLKQTGTHADRGAQVRSGSNLIV